MHPQANPLSSHSPGLGPVKECSGTRNVSDQQCLRSFRAAPLGLEHVECGFGEMRIIISPAATMGGGRGGKSADAGEGVGWGKEQGGEEWAIRGKDQLLPSHPPKSGEVQVMWKLGCFVKGFGGVWGR